LASQVFITRRNKALGQALIAMLKRIATYISLLVFLGPIAVSAQSRKLQNQPKYDNRPVHFGFCLGINTYDFQIRPKQDLAAIPGVYDMFTTSQPGYSIGIISNLRLGKYFDLRFIPTFSSTVRRITFDMDEPFTNKRVIKEYQVESSFIQFPFELKYRSERINNHGWYVLAGFEFATDLASKEKVEDDTIFKIKRSNAAAQAGVGIDIYFEYFKFSPQIKYSWGINNMLVEDGTVPVSGIDKLLSRCFLINFTFE
jgi:hypothetical protein